mmetsp:Transcript_98228/g.174018  ORF Transcript_98228/g.174018 Transcript_98228/m.174018 type:complete len:765 (-) Transcript_98228:73-2367(-)
MTVSGGAQVRGPVVVFDLIATFLEKCQFRDAANAIRVQCSEKEVAVEAEFAKHMRILVDGCVLLLGEFESMMYTGLPAKTEGEEEAALEQIIDGLLRKLMAAGHSLSDEKLTNSIDGVLSSDLFAKLTMMDGVLERGAATDALGINDMDVHRYWEQIQKESMIDVQPSKEEAAPEQAAAPDAQADPTQAAAPQPTFGAPLPAPNPSAHYVPRRPRGEGTTEDWDENDEYHDDDDPGYRIREIYEAELLAELSAKMAAGRVPGGEGLPGVQQTSPAPAGEVVDELASCVSTPAQAGEKPATGEETAATAEAASGDAASGITAPAAADAQAGEKRAASPTFGATAPAEDPASTATAQASTTAGATAEAQQQQAAEASQAATAESRVETKQRTRKNVKYAASGDAFYPVELDGVIYDSFNLRIVFERDKTGFEESKEFPIRMNSVIAARYQILEYLGSAAFSRAVQCLDLETNKMVCMKIIKNDKDFFDQSLDEIKLLKYINVNGDVDEHCVLRLYDYFYHKEHLIIVTELLRDNLYEFSKFNRECGDEPYFTLGRLQKIAKQVLTSLNYVHSLRLIHCDLKPENILIRSYSRCEVKVIDFGSSCFVDDHLSSYVQSRSYRAPEVMLGLPYDQKIDLWSLGCILAELWTGYVIFQNDSVQSLLARVLGIIGEFPYHLMTRGRYVPQYFTQDGQLYQEIDGPACPERGRRLHLLVPKKTSLQQRMRTESGDFLDFLQRLLQLDPAKRPTAAEALSHPWITQCKYPDGL